MEGAHATYEKGEVSSIGALIFDISTDLTAGGTACEIAGSVGDTASGIAGSAAGMPDRAPRKAQGNPMADAMVALGAGWLVGSLLPASQRERDAARAVEEKAQPVLEEAQELGKEAAANLKEPAQQAADVSQSATESQQRVQEHQARPDTTLRVSSQRRGLTDTRLAAPFCDSLAETPTLHSGPPISWLERSSTPDRSTDCGCTPLHLGVRDRGSPGQDC